jgi:hypothetical protein
MSDIQEERPDTKLCSYQLCAYADVCRQRKQALQALHMSRHVM